MSRWNLLVLIPALLMGVAIPAIAEDVDAPVSEDEAPIRGVLWTFYMRSHKKDSPLLYGLFRVDGKQHYQESIPDPALYNPALWRNGPPVESLKGFDKLIGTTTDSKAKHANIQIDDLQATTRHGKWHHGIKGKLELTYANDKQWRGDFTDSEGTRWTVDCHRLRK